MNKTTLMAVCLSLLLSGCDSSPPNPSAPAATESSSVPSDTPPTPAQTAPKELDWDALIPPEWNPETLMQEYNVDELQDNDPRAMELMDRLRELWDQAPVVDTLDGAAVRLPGFVVPLETQDGKVSEFLLMPYYGACVHVPPPPANQTVYVVTEQDKAKAHALFDTVWVTGTLSVKHSSSEVGEAGYTLYASDVSPYEE